MRLSELKINRYAIIVSLQLPNSRSQIRLLEMGVTPGTMIRKTKNGLWNDPIAIALRGYELCISKKEASYIWIEVVR